jgi:putative pyruvate formate lyase activating enzyme
MAALPRSFEGFVRARRSFEPAYLETYESGALAEKVAAGLEALRSCRVCPRDCDVDRLAGERAVCRTGRRARVASAFPHFGEEDCLRGWRGSGTIFFANCNLRCVFCQNSDISWEGAGDELEAAEIARLMIALQDRGCHNINLVTPEHVVPQVLAAVLAAIPLGLRVPLVYNTGAYDSLHSIELLDGVVDIYMPDFKFWDEAIAKRLVLAPGYPASARAAIRAMYRQVGDLVVDENGLALRGVLVRHLIMPHDLAGTREIMRFLAREVSVDPYVNVMDQYSPAGEGTPRSTPTSVAPTSRRQSASPVRKACTASTSAGGRCESSKPGPWTVRVWAGLTWENGDRACGGHRCACATSSSVTGS